MLRFFLGHSSVKDKRSALEHWKKSTLYFNFTVGVENGTLKEVYNEISWPKYNLQNRYLLTLSLLKAIRFYVLNTLRKHTNIEKNMFLTFKSNVCMHALLEDPCNTQCVLKTCHFTNM